MAFSGSLGFNIQTTVPDCTLGDVITFELISEFQATGRNWTGSLTQGNLTIDLLTIGTGGYPVATSSAAPNGFISTTLSPNIIIFNTSISSFYGGQYTQIPIFQSGSTVSSSLYANYGDITYPFVVSLGDKIVIKAYDGRTQLVNIKSSNYTGVSGSSLSISTFPDLEQYWITNPDQIKEFLIVKRLQDEQNVIMTFAKPPGETSYGFIIPENIDLRILESVGSIQSNVQQQLLSTQQNSQ